jgi:hypothetical protein
MRSQDLPFDPLEFIRRFRRNYVNFHGLWRAAGKAPPGVELRTPSERPIVEDDLPAGLRALLAEHREHDPRGELAYLKYMRTVDGRPVLIVEDESGLPEEDELLTVSHTVTLVTSDRARVVTDLLVARVRR